MYFRPQSLMNWDPSDPTSLLRAVQELLEEYEAWQEEVISRCSLLHFQYTSLFDGGEDNEIELDRKHVEVHVTQKKEQVRKDRSTQWYPGGPRIVEAHIYDAILCLKVGMIMWWN